MFNITVDNEVESVGNMRQQQTNLRLRLNEGNEMKLKLVPCFETKVKHDDEEDPDENNIRNEYSRDDDNI